MKSESFFQVLVYTWKIVKLESSFQHKTFQLNVSHQVHPLRPADDLVRRNKLPSVQDDISEKLNALSGQ